MASAEPNDLARRERGKALVRTVFLTELQNAGAARALALHQADQELDRIARVLGDALGAGLSLSEIARVTGVSRPTLYELRGRYSEKAADLRLALLQVIASAGTIEPDELWDRLGGKTRAKSSILGSFEEQGLVEWDFDDRARYALTDAGFHLLEHWTFEEEE